MLKGRLKTMAITTERMQPASNGTVVDNIICQIRNAISSGRFRSGDRLPSEFELMEELNVSRNSLREAMKILSAIGIVEIRRGDGTYICNQVKYSFIDSVAYSVLLENSTSEELIEFRRTLDEDVLMLAVKKATKEDVENLQEIINEMRLKFSNGEIGAAAKLDYRFHQYLASCTKNNFMERMVLGVYALFERSIEKNIRTEELFAMADQHHQDMLNCIQERDTSKVPDVIARSLSSWCKDVKAKIAD